MIIVDTSVWVSHLREGNRTLENLLIEGKVFSHPFVIGELACGNIKDRKVILALLELLPVCVVAEHEEILSLIEKENLMGKGLGYIDVSLLAAAILTGVPLWTLDKKLARTAALLRISYT